MTKLPLLDRLGLLNINFDKVFESEPGMHFENEMFICRIIKTILYFSLIDNNSIEQLKKGSISSLKD